MSRYCKYCDSLIPLREIVNIFDDNHRLVWVGCIGCYERKIYSSKKV